MLSCELAESNSARAKAIQPISSTVNTAVLFLKEFLYFLFVHLCCFCIADSNVILDSSHLEFWRFYWLSQKGGGNQSLNTLLPPKDMSPGLFKINCKGAKKIHPGP